MLPMEIKKVLVLDMDDYRFSFSKIDFDADNEDVYKLAIAFNKFMDVKGMKNVFTDVTYQLMR